MHVEKRASTLNASQRLLVKMLNEQALPILELCRVVPASNLVLLTKLRKSPLLNPRHPSFFPMSISGVHLAIIAGEGLWNTLAWKLSGAGSKFRWTLSVSS